MAIIASKMGISSFFPKEELQRIVLSKDYSAPVFIMRAIGNAQGVKSYQSKFEDKGETKVNDGIGLVGSFKIISNDSRIITGSTLYLPDHIARMIDAALSGDDVEGVQFAYDIYVEKNPKSATGYSYIVEDVTGESEKLLTGLEKLLEAYPMPNAQKALA